MAQARGELEAAPGEAARAFARAWVTLAGADTRESRELRVAADLEARRAVARATFGRPLHTIGGEGGRVRSLCFDEGEEQVRLMVGRYEGRVQWFDLETYQQRDEISGLGAGLRCAQRSPDARFVAVALREDVRLLNIDTRRSLHPYPTPSRDVIRWCAFSRDRPVFATCSERGSVSVWGWSLADRSLVWSATHGGKANMCLFSADGATLYAVGSQGGTRSWNARIGQPGWSVEEGREVHACALSPDGKTLATVGAGGTVRFWQAKSGDDRGSVGVAAKALEAVAYSPDGKTLAAGSSQGIVYLWSLGERPSKWAWDVDTGTQGSIKCLLISEDGRTLFVGCESGVVRIHGLWHTDWEGDAPEIPGFDADPLGAVERALNR